MACLDRRGQRDRLALQAQQDLPVQLGLPDRLELQESVSLSEEHGHRLSPTQQTISLRLMVLALSPSTQIRIKTPPLTLLALTGTCWWGRGLLVQLDQSEAQVQLVRQVRRVCRALSALPVRKGIRGLRAYLEQLVQREHQARAQ